MTMWMNGLFSVFSIFFVCTELSRFTAEGLWSRKEQREFTDHIHHDNTARKLTVQSTRKRHAGKRHEPDENEKIRSHGIGRQSGIRKEDNTHKDQAVKTRKRVHAYKHAGFGDNTFLTWLEETQKSEGKVHRGDSRKELGENEIHKLQKKDEKQKGKRGKEIKENTTQKPSEKQEEDEKDHPQLPVNRRGDGAEKSFKSDLSNETLKLLHKALLVHPFKTWKFKDRFQSMSDLGIHEAQLHDIIDNKWNERLKHKLHKVFQGEDIHLAIIGGSNSAGGGIQEDEGGTEGVFFRVISDWWRKTITPITGSRLMMRQIAMGGTGSDFFQYCYEAYIQENVDIVLLEMSVNDLKVLPPAVNLSLPIEQLTRQLLTFHTKPAVIYVNLLSGRTYYQGCTNLEDFGQRLLSDVYDVTTFSWRDAVCPMVHGAFRTPLKTCGVVCKDGHHINQLGHAHISLMVINLLRDLLLDNLARAEKGSREMFNDHVTLPEPVFITSPNKIITSPICWSTVSPNYKKATIKNSMDVGVMENFGFDYLHNEKLGGKCPKARSCRGDAYSGWTGKDVGAILTLSFTVPALQQKRGRIRSRSVVFATRTCGHCGAAEIWMDDDYEYRKFVRAKSLYSQTFLEIVALRVKPGDHTMNVKVVEPGEVTVVGVMLGPPDGPY